jgi:hypothetical protein
VKITIKEYNGSKLDEGIKLCHRYRLYIIGWRSQEWISKAYLHEVQCILIAFKNNIPIGSLIALDDEDIICNVGVFIRKSERLHGYGSKLLLKFRRKYPKFHVRWDHGINGSDRFFMKTLMKS